MDHPALRLVLDTGTSRRPANSPGLRRSGLRPPGLLLPDLHVKDPPHAADGGPATPGTAFDDLPGLLWRVGVRSVLVENDYRHARARLRTDIMLCRIAVGLSHPKDGR